MDKSVENVPFICDDVKPSNNGNIITDICGNAEQTINENIPLIDTEPLNINEIFLSNENNEDEQFPQCSSLLGIVDENYPQDHSNNNTESQKICDNLFTLSVLSDKESNQLEDAYRYFREHFDNFIFEGGGIRGIGFGGSLKYAKDHNLLNHIKRFAGSSAGAIVAAGLAVGYDGDEIIKVLHETNFEEFKDDSFGVILDIWRFVNEYGVYKGEKFMDWVGNILKAKTGNPDITFKEVFDRYGKELIVTGTNLNQYTTRYFHYKKDPNMPVRLAIRISMSIPVFFKAVKLTEYECGHCHNMMPDNDKPCYDCGKLNYYICGDESCKAKITSGFGICTTCKHKNIFTCYKCHEPLVKETSDGSIKKTKIDQFCWNCKYECLPKQCANVYVDGGVLNNYPIWVFDGQYIGDPRFTSAEIQNSRSIGFKLMTDQGKKDYQLFRPDSSINGIIDFLTSLINSMSIQIERGHIRTGYWDKTVTINTHNVNWLEFNLPTETKEKLIQQGYDALHDKILEFNNNITKNFNL